MVRWKAIWEVIRGESLDAGSALNRNAGIGIFLLLGTVLMIVMMETGKLPDTPFMIPLGILEFFIGAFACYSWLVARNDEIRRNKLLLIQGKLFLVITAAFAFWFVSMLHSISHPAPGAEAFKGRVGYSPGIISGSILYFGRHLSDFSPNFEMETIKYTKLLLLIGIVMEAFVIYEFVQAMTVFLDNF